MDAQTMDKLKAENPNDELTLIQSDDDGIEIVVKPASPATFAKYQALAGDITDGGKRSQAAELLVLGALVWPDRDEFRKEIEQRCLTGFYRSAAPEVAKITGARDNLRVSKL